MSRRSDRFKKILPTDIPRREPESLNELVQGVGWSASEGAYGVVERAKDFAERRKKPKLKKRITHTEFRIKLDFTVRVDGDQVMPDAFGPKYMNFIAAGLRATMLQEPTYAKGDLTVDVLPGSGLSLSVKRIKEK